MTSALTQLLDRARGPLGPRVEVDLGTESGPLKELGDVLSQLNGFFAYNAGLQVFHAGPEGLGPDLVTWNDSETWKATYGGLADQSFCFAQDVLGTQHAIVGGDRILRFDPETAHSTVIGSSLEDWAAWVQDDPAVNATAGLALEWQRQNGALEPNERLIPLQFFVAGGGYEFDNLVVRDGAAAMRVRGPVAQQIKDLPDGAHIRLHFD
ncbi:SMI1/KNR4 family protein [Streptomyces sp. BB1-1-1]|uniref:SMI1/KNR4 family protein n=1 Tax=Streptomyces sp. BB1-1-1 TaxID=3074430 RepID=UPI0028776A82|nr:SMI1/KNR4 family protein [Streptomyces sp. BB1-1-1]WND35848.1 SMI1/KNR4 family protein [Streptomyces sp. BB1-1-1]